VVLATGAVPQALAAAGLCERSAPSGVALRGYFRHEALARTLQGLHIVWHPRLAGGYGWIFPGPDGVFNIGTGVVHGAPHGGAARGWRRRRPGDNLRRMLDTFAEVYPPAAELLARGTPLGELKGAPLRCSLRGGRWSAPGLLVAGEAAGSTYNLTGEGIGKAMETGLLAAQALAADLAGSGREADAHAARDASAASAASAADAGADLAVRQAYEAALRALQPRFDIYEAAAHVNRRPWLAEFVLWRASRSPRILRRMSGVLAETQMPRLLTWRGLWRLIVE
jgi:flavin-dependent dehydrogenase